MRFLVVTPASPRSTKGNRITAERWATMIRGFGHHVVISESFVSGPFDVLIALHARKSAKAVFRIKEELPECTILVALTGTDLNFDLGRTQVVEQSLEMADRIILLEPEGGKLLQPRFRKKTVVIFQSSTPLVPPPAKLKRNFEVAVLGHLRSVKDPFRAAKAARLLPCSSRIKVVHFGAALTEEMAVRARHESDLNRRYQWYGPVRHSVAIRRLARSHLFVLSSKSEGAPAVISEAIMNNVPMLVTRIPSTIGMLGKCYPGFFETGDTQSLAALMNRAETDPKFYRQLALAGKALKDKFSPSSELANWKQLLETIGNR